MSQFKKLEQDFHARGEIKWKHAMHLMRLLLPGISALREGELRVRLDEHRAALLAIKRGEQPWLEANSYAVPDSVLNPFWMGTCALRNRIFDPRSVRFSAIQIQPTNCNENGDDKTLSGVAICDGLGVSTLPPFFGRSNVAVLE